MVWRRSMMVKPSGAPQEDVHQPFYEPRGLIPAGSHVVYW